MNNTIYFLRHAETKVDKNMPISAWQLSENGIKQVEELSQTNIFNDIDVIISSAEEKAVQTAQPFVHKLGKEITRIPELNELDRDKGGFLEKDEFDKTVKFCLTNRDKSINNWETANHALERFSKKIEKIDAHNENKKILIVAHGFVLNLYFAQLLHTLDRVFDRMQKSSYCDWGIVKDKKVIKDIIKE